eukprot:CAMPEP_0118862280 /NCGR_PEP_ID=MMETSP1163-20130328/7536_1 /TAXON_ID=124430 /ORGANISM="Phaeomonas parva, Strain CCMP2877" /LENGTH=461 /DNA_ID=CAMNT_0006796169 /DNA_START=87 /DNA_END=1469 /DNA_ORIENTATION=-
MLHSCTYTKRKEESGGLVLLPPREPRARAPGELSDVVTPGRLALRAALTLPLREAGLLAALPALLGALLAGARVAQPRGAHLGAHAVVRVDARAALEPLPPGEAPVDGRRERAVPAAHEARHGAPLRPRRAVRVQAPGAPGAVQVIHGVPREVEVHDVLHHGNVQAARGDVGAHEDREAVVVGVLDAAEVVHEGEALGADVVFVVGVLALAIDVALHAARAAALAEGEEALLALVAGHLGVVGHLLEAALAQRVGHGLRALDAVAEDHGALLAARRAVLVLAEHVQQRADLVLALDVPEVVAHRGAAAVQVRGAHLAELGQEGVLGLLELVAEAAGDGRRGRDVLGLDAVLGVLQERADELLELRAEALGEHGVDLVDDHVLDAAEVDVAGVPVLEQAARTRDEHVHGALELLLLLALGLAADDHAAAELGVVAQRLHGAGHLDGELARGHEHERAGALGP